MAQESKLHLEQSQRLSQRLSPLQIRYSRLLEMSEPELEQEVSAALEENPALEPVEHSAEPIEQKEFEQPAFFNPADYSPDDDRWEPQHAADSLTLAEYLEEQLAERAVSPADRLIATYIIGNIDDNGYLTRSTAMIASDMNIDGHDEVDTADVNHVLAMIQSFEPAGVGARDLRECMLLQLTRREAAHSTEALRDALEIVTRHYDRLSRMQLRQLVQTTGMTQERVNAALEIIRTLNPKPGASATPAGRNESVNIVIPDYSVERDGDRFIVSLPSHIPELTLSESFAIDSLPMAAPRDREAAKIVLSYRSEAENLIKALRMRADTMMAVMKAIVARQKEFFRTDNPLALKPMVLKDIAADTGYDISTVSRATGTKYVATHGGIFPVKMFFNERATDDTDITAREIMEALKAVIEEENPRKPMSDDALVAELAKKGFNIARRTVTKYRERLGIPTSRLRRKL